MKKTALVVIWAALALVCNYSTPHAADLAALPVDTQSLTGAYRVYVVWAGQKTDSFAQGLMGAYSKETSGRGYQEPKVNMAAGDKPAMPRFSSVMDAQKWLKDGHTVHIDQSRQKQFGGLAGLANLVSSGLTYPLMLNAAIVLEAAKVNSAVSDSGFMKGLTKMMGGSGISKPTGSEVYLMRATLMDDKGGVVWSVSETVDKERVEKMEEERLARLYERSQAEMKARLGEGKQLSEEEKRERQKAFQKKSMDAFRNQTGGMGMENMPPDVRAKYEAAMAQLSPEQRALYEQQMKKMESGEFEMYKQPVQPQDPEAAKRAFIAGRVKASADPSKWAEIVAKTHWEKISEFLPDIGKEQPGSNSRNREMSGRI